MLAIRMQRTGRKGHAMFRVVVQDARRTPTSGRVVAVLGHYDPHTKAVDLVKDKAGFYLEHGAQPSDRVVKLFQAEGIQLPDWVSGAPTKKRAIRNPQKLRRNQPKEVVAPAAPAAAEAPVGTETPAAEANAEAEATEA